MKQYAIIGIGNFGRYLAIHLYEKGHDVTAVDRRASLIQDIKDQVSQAVVADATDMKALEGLGLEDMDAVIVCIGESGLSNSILATLNIKDIGVKRLLCKAVTEPQARILRKIGADEVFFPEKDQAVLLGERLHNPNLLDYLPLMEGFSMVQFVLPEDLSGKSLKELDMINRFGVQVVAIKELAQDRLIVVPTGNFILRENDVLIVLGPNDALEKIQKGRL